MRIATFILTLLILQGCFNKKDNEMSYTRSSDTIPITAQLSFSLFQYKHPFIYFLNADSTQLIVINSEQKKMVANIQIPQSLYNNTDPGGIHSFYVHNHDSIFLQDLYGFSIIDSAGRIKYHKTINSPGLNHWPPILYNNIGGVFPMYYDATLNKLFTRQYSGEKMMNEKGFYTIKVEANMDLNDSIMRELPVEYPPLYVKNYCGEANLVFREVDDSANIYSFMASPDIVIYNRYNGHVKHLTAKSKLQNQGFKPLSLEYSEDMNRKVDHMVENPLYMKIIYDKYRSCYYRMLLNGKELKNKDGSYNTFSDKELIVSVFDKDFQLLTDVNLGSNYLWNYSFATPKGLYILKISNDTYIKQATINEKNLIFDVINFNNGHARM